MLIICINWPPEASPWYQQPRKTNNLPGLACWAQQAGHHVTPARECQSRKAVTWATATPSPITWPGWPHPVVMRARRLHPVTWVLEVLPTLSHACVHTWVSNGRYLLGLAQPPLTQACHPGTREQAPTQSDGTDRSTAVGQPNTI